MPFHICPEEIVMFLATIPFIGVLFKKINVWYHSKTSDI